MNIDKKILGSLQNVTREEREAVMAVYNVLEREPQTKLYMAILRDAVMFREMSMATLLKYKEKIRQLERRITDLENAKQQTPEEEE